MRFHSPSLAEHFSAAGPKRILALDGGGVRGILSLGFLLRIEALLRSRHGDDPAFRLCDYFDLIAGTSTGSIIAALLAQGRTVREVIELYLRLAGEVFAPRWWEFRLGILRPRYKPETLASFLKAELGADCRIGDPEALRTGLLVMCKRIDSGSPWPISNNPRGRYFAPNPARPRTIANSDYLLWKVVRASTAAPTFFRPQHLTISEAVAGARDPVSGQFIDGGVSPHNNPALQAYWLATLEGFGLRWTAGRERLLIISVGTGRTPVQRDPGWIAALQGVTALQGLMDDCGAMVESLMQGLGQCLGEPRHIDAELGSLSPHQLTGEARFSYARFDVKLFHEEGAGPPRDGQDDNPYLRALNLGDEQLRAMQRMDNARSVRQLLALGQEAAADKVQEAHFPAAFDLRPATMETQADSRPPSGAARGSRPYRQRPGKPVTAIRLNLDLEAFTYHKWGALQSAKPGDWLVERDGAVHSVDAQSFARTYRQVGPATYVKEATVWAKPADEAGVIPTLEGETHYRRGDYLVWNDREGQEGYAIAREKFETLYEPIELAKR
ncbi:MAG: patatin-like phospholipase family protein [Cyanobium sp.]